MIKEEDGQWENGTWLTQGTGTRLTKEKWDTADSWDCNKVNVGEMGHS